MSLLPFSIPPLPGQKGRNGKILKTSGSKPYWGFNLQGNPLAGLVRQPTVSSETFSGAGVTFTTTPPTFTSVLNLTYSTAVYTAHGGLMVADAANAQSYNIVNSVTNNAAWANGVCHYGNHIAFKFRAQATSGYYWVWVDGKPLTSTEVSVSGLTAGSIYYLDLPFLTTAMREIRVYSKFFGTSGYQTETVSGYGPAPYRPLQILAIGDSWFEGAAGIGINLWPQKVAYYLNADIYLAALGGTGYVATGIYTPYGSTQRLNALAPLASLTAGKPNLIWIEGSVNDQNQAGLGTVGPAATALYNNLAALFPGTPIIVSTVQSLNDAAGFSGNFATINNEVIAAAQASPYVTGIINARATPPGRWLTGSGTVANPQGNGNGDIFLYNDAIHLVAAGHDYYAYRTAAEMAKIIVNQ